MLENITLALPSKGAIADPTRSFLQECGLKISKPNERQYTGSISSLPSISVLFQRVKDVAYKVADGTVEIGITGYDVICENPNDNLLVIHDRLGYGHCKLVVAVPEAWVDVESMLDLAEIALDFREHKGRNLRVATTYTHLARQFLHSQGIHHFTLVKAEGAIEAAPMIGYADVVVDLTQTGTTLRENHLKMLSDGVVVESQACLIGNKQALRDNPAALETVRILLETIDSALIGREYSRAEVNIRGKSAEEVAGRVAANPLTRGLLGPTIAPVYNAMTETSASDRWFTATITIQTRHLLPAVEFLRSIGGAQVIISPVRYIFMESSPTYTRLLSALASG